MFIENIEDLNIEVYKCNKYIGTYLIEHGVPLLGLGSDGKYIFALSNITKSALENIPFYLNICKILP